ncbi:hypothetical protein [Pontibacter flavimaris]|uniref:Phage abortive infection protein n=1 Tax=Pontibacter flavimaris TaxID=1797110 RepID=A0A1Q5PG32_9BACT|nr:hypothetical protein [Pontibacter flavimaris]OKL41199.1 hypothetical protein A3841_15380 [Pontibacter flavimaris]
MESTFNNREKSWFPPYILLGIFIFCSFLIGIVILFTRKPLYSWYDISEGGAVGDAIGGITAPFINLLGAILVYLALRAQNKANTIQKKALEEEADKSLRLEISRQVESILTEVSQELDSLELQYKIFHHAVSTKPGGNYFLYKESESNKGLNAIKNAIQLLHHHEYWNLNGSDPQGSVKIYYTFAPDQLTHLFKTLRYIQLSLTLIINHTSLLEHQKIDSIYLRAKVFYSTKLAAYLQLFDEALSKTALAYETDFKLFHTTHKFIDDYFGGPDAYSDIHIIINEQNKSFIKRSSKKA